MTTPANPPADLVTWLRAQLDEDERIAREALRELHGVTSLCIHLSPEVISHNDRHLPARVLAEVDAKRQLLDCLVGATGQGSSRLVANDEPWAIGSDHLVWLLALPFAGRPGFREEWKP